MTDVLLRQTNDGGDITVENGLVLLTDGLETAVYLSLFGGNQDDPGQGDTTQQWWGNLLETDPTRTYRSETQYLLKSLPLIPVNLRRVEQAAARDLQWMLDAALATKVEIAASIPALNHMRIDVAIQTASGTTRFTFG
jgi:phage gp46-like protein